MSSSSLVVVLVGRLVLGWSVVWYSPQLPSLCVCMYVFVADIGCVMCYISGSLPAG